LSKRVSVMLWLFLLERAKVLEVFLGCFESRRCLGDLLDKTGLTGLQSRPDRFPLPVERLSSTKAV
jgi:hypothetical protein